MERSEPTGVAATTDISGAFASLYGGQTLGVLVRQAVPRERCEHWAAAVRAARAEWTSDFEGEQFSLGRAFYTHLETGREEQYFAAAVASDALVEARAPGLQQAMRDLVANAVGGGVVRRRGWCSAGVHVFPAGGEVATHGGVVHFDVEGLTEGHIARRLPAVSLVLMLQAPARGGGLRLWPVLHEAGDDTTHADSSGDVVVEYRVGDALVFDSYRQHQILPFEGTVDRVSATLHAAQIDQATWESWF